MYRDSLYVQQVIFEKIGLKLRPGEWDDWAEAPDEESSKMYVQRPNKNGSMCLGVYFEKGQINGNVIAMTQGIF